METIEEKKEVKVNPLKLRIFETKFTKVGSREKVFSYFDKLLAETKGAKFYAAIGSDEDNPNEPRIIHTNPSDEVVCAEAIAREIRQCDMSRAEEGSRGLFVEDVKAWLEDVKRRNEEPEDVGASAPNPSIAINEEELKKYFQVSFYNERNGSTDWFSRLIADLKIKRSGKDYARIANMIYNGGWLQPRKKPATFAEWYRVFCDLIGCEHYSYKPNKLKEIESFNYLKRP